MKKWIDRFFLRRAFEDYVLKLGPALIKCYGSSDQYTVKQVETTVRDLKLNPDFIRYAIALYRFEESKNTLNLYSIGQSELDCLRSEIAHSLFSGNLKFTASDVIAVGKSKGWSGGVHTNWMANKNGQTGF